VFLLYSMRRVDCRPCGVRVESVPWAEGKRQTTISFEWFLAIWARRLSWTEEAEIFGTSWEAVFLAVERAVDWAAHTPAIPASRPSESPRAGGGAYPPQNQARPVSERVYNGLMRGRVVVPLLSLFLLATAAFPACSYSPVYSGQYRTSVLDLAIDGVNLWTATSYGVTLYDRSVDPPSPVSTIAVPGVTRIVRTANGIAYAGSGSKLYTIVREGLTLRIAGQLDAGATINDLVVLPATIYAATANGLVQFDLFDPRTPVRSTNTFPTSSPNVLSIALTGSTLYAADGDSSVEIFSLDIPTLPQALGALTSLPRASSVKAGGGKVFVSDAQGQQTDVFSGGRVPTRAVTLAFGASALALLTNDVIFAAGGDLQLRAVDLTTAAAPIALYTGDVPRSGGTINRLAAMQLAGGRLYIAAGDGGLLSYDVSAFTAPFPVRGYDRGAMTSVLSLGQKIYVTPATGSIIEYLQSATGVLTQARQWNGSQQRVYDGNANGFLISSSGPTLTYWSLASTPPAVVASVTFAKPVVSAALVGNVVYALLADKSLASADMALLSPVASRIPLDAINPTAIARSGPSLAIVDIRDDRTTRVLFFATPDFTTAPRVATVPGFATSGVALAGTVAAVFTFTGVNVIDFAAPAPSPVAIPGSTSALAQSLAINTAPGGSSIIEATERSLLIWDLQTLKLTRELPLPSSAVAVSVSSDSQSNLADLATSTGVVTVSYKSALRTPAMLGQLAANNYYRKIAATADHVYLYDGRGVDIFTNATGTALHYVATVRPTAIIDFAATPSALYTLTTNGTVASYSPDGAPLAQVTLNEGTDAQWLSLAAANGVAWVGLGKGCLTTGCQKATIVLDPRTLVETARLNGAVTSAGSDGTRVFALFDVPSEFRAYDAGDPLHPSQLATRAVEGTRPAVSIAASNGSVLVIGDRLYTYDALSLTGTSTQLDAWTPDPSNVVAYVDQRLFAESGCTLLTGRTFSVQPLGEPAITMPAVVKSIASQKDRLLLLTDYSIEIWSKAPAASKPKRRAAR